MNRLFFVLVASLIILLIDWYAFQSIKSLFTSSSQNAYRIAKYIYISLSVLVVISILVYNFGNPDGIAKHARTFLMTFIFINVLGKVVLALFTFIDDIQRGVRWAIMKLSNPEPAQDIENGITRSKFIATSGIIMAAAPILSLSWGIVSGAHDYRIRKVKVPIKNLPKAFEGLKIAQLSDIHSGSFWNKIAVKGGVEMLLNEKPDMVFFTGDLVNNRATEMGEWGDVFRKVNAPLGVYSVLGNHDYGDYVSWNSDVEKRKNLADLKTIQKNMGWQLLVNEHKVLEIDGEKLNVVGVENWGFKARFPKYGKLDRALEGLNPDHPTILLSHDPSHWQAQVVGQNDFIDLTLSGHTHGMQFGIEIPGFKWSPVQYMYDEWAGLYRINNQNLYVNRGFGYIGYPGRFGILPEITILNLESA